MNTNEAEGINGAENSQPNGEAVSSSASTVATSNVPPDLSTLDVGLQRFLYDLLLRHGLGQVAAYVSSQRSPAMKRAKLVLLGFFADSLPGESTDLPEKLQAITPLAYLKLERKLLVALAASSTRSPMSLSDETYADSHHANPLAQSTQEASNE